jgi:hypothetical protein
MSDTVNENITDNDGKLSEEKHKDDEAENDETQVKQPWRSCCFDMDPRVVKFFTSVMFSMILLLFCVLELSSPSLQQERFTLYISIVTGVVNLWMPCPKIK